jgi:Tfp pilus assembly protein PilF
MAVRSKKRLTTAHAASPATPATAAELYRRAIQHQQHGQFRKAERACRQALYLESDYLPAMELLAALWRHQKPHPRLRLALEARIHRISTREAVEPAKDIV